MGKTVFEGLKVAEFAWVVVGPATTSYLASHGATVVRIESHTRLDPIRVVSPFAEARPGVNRSMFYGRFNANKYGVSLDLETAGGRELAWRFIEWADVVVESYTPGVMKRWGLDYDAVRRVRPDLIYLSTCTQGQSGPYALAPGYGPLVVAMAGFAEISGWPDREPSPPYGAYADLLCPPLASTALISALEYQRRTGKGQHIDQSQLETSLHYLAPLIMDYAVNARVAGRVGNRLPYASPHGLFPCRGTDQWIAIAVFSDEQWHCFCAVMATSDWTRDPRFATLEGRKRNEDELERLVAEWTVGYTAEQIEAMMQSAGVPASVVEHMSDLFEDPQLRHRNYFVRLNHPEMGEVAYEAITGYRLAKAPRELIRPSPCLGEHNEYVYKDLLGLTDDEISDYIVDGVITVPDDEEASFSL